MLLKNKIAIVTGSARGIGRTIAVKIAENGGQLVLVDIDEEGMETTKADISKIGSKALCCKANVSREEDVLAVIKSTLKEYGTIDILVNNAGIVTMKNSSSLSLDEWNETLAINLTGTFLCSKYAFETMKKNKYGKIINISSLGGQSGGVLVGADYCASKGGLISYSKSLALEAANYNINVNVVAPSTIPTEGIAQFGPDKMEELREKIPLKRLGKPEDVGNLVVFLASDNSCFITGATIDINGGMAMR